MKQYQEREINFLALVPGGWKLWHCFSWDVRPHSTLTDGSPSCHFTCRESHHLLQKENPALRAPLDPENGPQTFAVLHFPPSNS